MDINVYGFNHVLFSTNLYYGGKAKLKSLAYICNIDIDFDDVCTIKMWTKLLRLIEENVILRPTILVNSGTGAHLIYRLKVPIYCYNKPEIKEVMKIIKEAICNKLCKVYNFKQDFKEKIQPLSIDQKIRAIDTESKIAEFAESKEEKEKYLCRAWLIGESWDINHLITYAKKEIEKNMYRYYFIAYEKDNTIDKKTMIDGFKATMDFLVSSVKVVKNAKTYSSGKKHYRSCNSNLYYSWLKRCEEVQMGHRYYAILGLCSYAKKCKILYEELETDALKLMDYYQKRDGKETFTIFEFNKH